VGDQAEWAGSLRPLLVRDHLRLEALLTRLLDRFREASPVGLRAIIWARFETILSAHIGAEERYLLPLFARVDSDEAAELLTENAAFRKALTDLGEGMGTNAKSLNVAPEFVGALRAHAQRENQLFCRWNECRVRSRGRIRWHARLGVTRTVPDVGVSRGGDQNEAHLVPRHAPAAPSPAKGAAR
jgi:hypothetical protein